MSASRASAATSARLAPPAAATAATMRPSTRGAGESVTRSRIDGSWSRSSASSALSTALPRSMSTTTPAGPSARSMASMIADRVGAERRLVEPGGHLDPQRAAVQHLGGQRDRGAGQRPAVGDDDQSDAVLGARGRRVSRKALCHVHCTPLARRLGQSGGSEGRFGRRFEQQRHGRRAGVLVPDAALAEVAGPALARQHRRGRVPTRRGGVAGVLQRRRPGPRRRRARRPARRRPAPARRTSSCRPARPCRGPRHRRARPAGRRRARAPRRSRRRRASCPSAGRACRTAGRSLRRPWRPASCPTLENSAPGRCRRVCVERGHGGLHAPVHVRPVVGVADRRVELGQVVAVLRDQVRRTCAPTPRGPPWSRSRPCAQMPHLSADVFTGASQSESSSSSTLSSVTDAPAMSSEVM